MEPIVRNSGKVEIEISEARIELSDLTLSGLFGRQLAPPKAMIVALHGGGHRAQYWHCQDPPEASLLTLGPRLGYEVIALDRPGYGACYDVSLSEQSVANQSRVLLKAIHHWRGRRSDLPVFLIGHSLGGIVALTMASGAAKHVVAGVDVSGIPLRYSDEMQEALHRPRERIDETHYSSVSRELIRELFFGPSETFETKALEKCVRLSAPLPIGELLDVVNCPRDLPPRMLEIVAPVQITIPEFERSSIGGEEMLEYARAQLTSSARVSTVLQKASAHNISMHLVARAYHLRALAFFDECLARNTQG
jgi:pimeloyl-ACP methyl ester carboxylesterase